MHFLYDRFTKITATKDVCTMALTDDNQIIAYTSDGDMYRIERVFAYGTTKIVDICAGYGHGYCIDTDGHLYKIAYSNNRQNQVQQEAIPFKLKSLACSYNHELAIAGT
jgi:alpha-tubulin suppressor-like RCC1 family protein